MRSTLIRRLGATAAALVVIAGGATLLAAPASADQVWFQSVGRVSATAECPTTTEADAAIGWSPWAPSWAEWANDGKGGYVCDRSITWAKDTPPPGAAVTTCTLIFPGQYVFLDASGYIPYLAPVYSDAACSSYSGPANASSLGFAFTSGGIDAATAICVAGNPGLDPAPLAVVNSGNLYDCVPTS